MGGQASSRRVGACLPRRYLKRVLALRVVGRTERLLLRSLGQGAERDRSRHQNRRSLGLRSRGGREARRGMLVVGQVLRPVLLGEEHLWLM
jgi:hypothetical protein